jgi:hypothetical protein
MKSDYKSVVSRRTTLQWLAIAMAVPFIPRRLIANPSAIMEFTLTAKGYGTDPDLNHPVVPWSRCMTLPQLKLTAALADLILPATDRAPAPSTLGIPDFVDEWVSAPYTEQLADKKTVLDGLDWIDGEAHRRWKLPFLRGSVLQQQGILNSIAGPDANSIVSPERRFFRRLRFLVVGAYYTTAEGFRDIGYIGNVPLTSYPPITEAEEAILDGELKRLNV